MPWSSTSRPRADSRAALAIDRLRSPACADDPNTIEMKKTATVENIKRHARRGNAREEGNSRRARRRRHTRARATPGDARFASNPLVAMTAAKKAALRQLSQAEIQILENLTERELNILTKVQARVKGWARRNKNRARLLEEARAAGGAYEIFTLPKSEKLVRRDFPPPRRVPPAPRTRRHVRSPERTPTMTRTRAHPPPSRSRAQHEVIVCNLGSTSLIGAGTLYVFDKHLAYHNPAESTFLGLVPCKPVKMLLPFRDMRSFKPKEEYFTSPGVVATMKNGDQHWWGGMYFPSAVADTVNNVFLGARRETEEMALAARTQAAKAVAANSRGLLATKDGVIRRLAADVAEYKLAAEESRREVERLRAKLAEALESSAGSPRRRVDGSSDAEEADDEADDARELRREIAKLRRRVAESETSAKMAESAREAAMERVAALTAELEASLEAASSSRDASSPATDRTLSEESSVEFVAQLDATRAELESVRAELQSVRAARDEADKARDEALAEAKKARDEADKALAEAEHAHAAALAEAEKSASDAHAAALAEVRLEAEKASWALESAQSARAFAEEALVREREAFERRDRDRKKRRAESKESAEESRAAREAAERESAALSARLAESEARVESLRRELETLEATRAAESKRSEEDAAERRESAKLRAVAETAAAAAKEAEKYAREQASADATHAREAAARETEARRELERAMELVRRRDEELASLASKLSDGSVAAAADAASLETRLEEKDKALEEKERALSDATRELAAMRAELTALAVHQERLANDADHARAEAERARASAKEGSDEYRAAVAAASAAEREAAAARAAEALARDINARSQTDVAEWIARERDAKEDLVELRVSHERLQQEFRDKTANALEKLAAAERTLLEERHKSETRDKSNRDRIAHLERARVDAEHETRRLREALERQKQETYYLYTNYANVANQLEDAKTALEREQEESIRMHQGFAAQKMQLAGAAGAGGGVGGLGLGYAGPPPQSRPGCGGFRAPAIASAPTTGVSTPAGLPSLESLMPSLAEGKAHQAAIAGPETPRVEYAQATVTEFD